ncbi:MAG: glycoside hydrolase family 15 protein [Planctomycetota bacterium]
MSGARRYPPIEDHGVIGDRCTVALVATDGTIDFLCWPRFDSPTVFAALLDRDRGGAFRIAPQGEVMRRQQYYLSESNVLVTRFLTEEGLIELTDFMPLESGGRTHELVRRVKCVRGRATVRAVCMPRFDYARAAHDAEVDAGVVRFRSRGRDGERLVLWSTAALAVDGRDAVAEFDLVDGEHASFVLARDDDRAGAMWSDRAVADAFKHTLTRWRDWIGRSRYRGRWREQVHRSALVLKLLTSGEHGSIVAAPTFGLPEARAGVRNWDYRYTWVRDASFTMYAFWRLGLSSEAARFNRWIGARCREDGGLLQVLYAVDGGRDLRERELEHLEGYGGSRPVRIGNAAHDQLQLDIYGELLDAIYLDDKHGEPVHQDLWQHLVVMVDWVCGNWDRADEGIWEVRTARRHFLYSRIMCWVAIDRALRMAAYRSLPCDVTRWRAARDAIHAQVFTEFWSERRGAFVQARETEALDASVLIMPLVRMIGATDPRWLSTLRAVEEELVTDSLVYRYRGPDGIPGGEGTFSLCTFWYVECLSRAGDVDKARLVFDKMLGHANHLGLFAEQLGACDEHRGNFPQALTHLALISAAFELDRRLDSAG